MRKATLLFNPQSGRHQDRRAQMVETVVRTLCESGVEVAAEATVAGAGTGEQVREALRKGSDTIVACGGDGTVHDVLQGMVHGEGALGIVPAGTANALAHDLGLQMNPVRAARSLLTAREVRVAVGQVQYALQDGGRGSRYFAVAAGVGVDAYLFYKLNPGYKLRLGMAAYYAKATYLWLTDPMHRFRVSCDDGRDRMEAEVSELLAVRIRHFGGVLRELAPGASLERRDLRLVLFKTRSRLLYLGYILRGMVGARWSVRGIELRNCVQAECGCLDGSAGVGKIFVEADGELLGRLPATLRAVPDALTLLVPRA